MTFSKKILLFLMLIGWAFATQAALEVTLESFKITKAGEKTSDNKLHGEYRLSFGKKDELQTHCFDHSMEFDPIKVDGWVGYQAKKLSGCTKPKVVYGKKFKLHEEFVLNRNFYKKSRKRFYQYSCEKEPPERGNRREHFILSNEIDRLDYKKCEKHSEKRINGNPTLYFDADKSHESQKMRLYSPIKVTEKDALHLCFFEMDFFASDSSDASAYFSITPFFPTKPTKIKQAYIYATYEYMEKVNNKDWRKKKKDSVDTCFELSAKTLLDQADKKNNQVVVHLKNENLQNRQTAEIALSIKKQVLPKTVTSVIKAFSEQLSERKTREQFITAQNNWAISYDSDNPSDKDKARSKTLEFPFRKATQIILHSRLLKGKQWVLPQGQLIGFLKEWILKKDREAYLVFKQNHVILGIRKLAPRITAQQTAYQTLSGYDVQIQWQQQTEPFSAKDLDIMTQGWIVTLDPNATVWLYKRNNSQPRAVFALKALRRNMPQPPTGIYNPKIYFSQLPPTGLENPWDIGKTRFFQATLKWLKTKDKKAWLTFEDNKGNTLINTIATVDFNRRQWPAHNLKVSIPSGLDFEVLKNLAQVKMRRGAFSREYPLSNTIELPRGHYNLSDFEIAVAYKQPWVAHLLDETRTGNRISLAYKTDYLPELTIRAPNNLLSDTEWKKYCHLEQHQDANKLFKALSEGKTKVNCYPLLVKNAVAPVEFRETEQSIQFNLHGIKLTQVKLDIQRSNLGDWYLRDDKQKSFLFLYVFTEESKGRYFANLIELMTQYEKSPKEVLQTTWYLTKEEVAQRYQLKFSLKQKREHSFGTVTPKSFFKTALRPKSVWASLRFEVTKENGQVFKNCQIKSETEFLCEDKDKNKKSLLLTDFIGATLQIQGLPDSDFKFSSDKQNAKIPLTAIRCGEWSKILPLGENRLFFRKLRKQSANDCDSIKLDLWSLKGSIKTRALSNNLCTFKTFNRQEMPTEQVENQVTKLGYELVTAVDANLGESQDVFCNRDKKRAGQINPPVTDSPKKITRSGQTAGETTSTVTASTPKASSQTGGVNPTTRIAPNTVNCVQQNDNKWLHLIFINSEGNWRKYYLAQKRKQFLKSLQARFPTEVGLYIWFLTQLNHEQPAKLIPFKQALKKPDLQDYQQAYKHLIRLPRKRGDSLPIDNQIARSLNLLKQQIETSPNLEVCDQHAVILLTNGLNASTASSQLEPQLPDWHHLVVLAGEEADHSILKGISLGRKVTFIPLNWDGQWREALVQQIDSIW
jgi:hypothetical protein